MLTLATGLARELTRNQRNSTPNSHCFFNIKCARAGIHPKGSKCVFKTHPKKKKLWSFIARLPWMLGMSNVQRTLAQMLASDANRRQGWAHTLPPSCYAVQHVCIPRSAGTAIPVALEHSKGESRILHSPSLFIQGSIGSRGTQSLIRKRPRNTDSEYASALLPRCLELLEVDYMKTRQEQDDTGRQTVKGCHFSAKKQLPVGSSEVMLKYTLQRRESGRKNSVRTSYKDLIWILL